MIPLSQTTYSNEEIKHLLQTLYDEKKRIKELNSKLQKLELEAQSTYTTNQNAAAVASKKQLEENAELVSENKALQHQVAFLKKHIEKLNQESIKHDPRHVELLHEAIERQNILEHELRKKVEELAALKESDQSPQETSSNVLSSEEISRLQDLVALLQEQLQKSNEEKTATKQSLEKGSREQKELSTSYNTVSKERSEAITKAQQYHNQLENLKHEILRLQSTLLKEREQKEALQRELAHLKGNTEKIETLQTDLVKERQRIDALDAEVALERHMRRDIDEELTRAQHHLAKKVKETALLEQSTEDIQKNWMEAQKVLTENKMKLTELQTAIELHRQQEARLHEQLREASNAAETQMARGEEKQLALSQKLQSAENRIQELVKLEEKQQRLQSILSDITTLFPSSLENEASPFPTALSVKLSAAPEKEKPFQNLFEMPRQAPKHRRSLLD